MRDRTAISERFAFNLQKTEEAARALAESVTSINALVAQTRTTLAESRIVLAQADRLLAEEICAPSRQQRDQARDPALTPTRSSAATRSPAE
jgi:hypothetical protein